MNLCSEGTPQREERGRDPRSAAMRLCGYAAFLQNAKNAVGWIPRIGTLGWYTMPRRGHRIGNVAGARYRNTRCQLALLELTTGSNHRDITQRACINCKVQLFCLKRFCRFFCSCHRWLTRRWFHDFFYDIFIACILCVFCYDGVWIVFSGAGWGGGCWRQGAG